MKFSRLMVLLLFVGCSTGKIVYDYDAKADFKKFQTFDFYDDVGDGMNALDIKRTIAVIEDQLKEKGFKKAKNPDFLINFISIKSELEDNNNVGIGIGGGRNVGFGVSGGITIGGKKISEELTIEFVNILDNQLFWEGTSTKKIKEKTTPEQRELYLQEVIRKMFEKYPPQKK